MTLSDYLIKHGISPSAFAELIDASQATVSRYTRRKRIPHRDHMLKIVEVTGGAVTPNDFYLEEGSDAAAGFAETEAAAA